VALISHGKAAWRRDLVGVRLWVRSMSLEGRYIVHGFSDLIVEQNRFQLPLEWHWKYRSSQSAGSDGSRMVGSLTRSHLAIRLSFPITQARRAVAQLVAVSLAVGPEALPIRQALHTLARRYRTVLEATFLHKLSRALDINDVWMIREMGS
jgi:hypothetical protein